MENTFITDDTPIIPAATETPVESDAQPVTEAETASETAAIDEINETPEQPVLNDVVQPQAVHMLEQRSFARRSANQPMPITHVIGE